MLPSSSFLLPTPITSWPAEGSCPYLGPRSAASSAAPWGWGPPAQGRGVAAQLNFPLTFFSVWRS